jgi:hypothetical protein
VGTIEMRTLGVYTKDFALYFDLLKVLRKRKIPYVSLSSLNHIPSRIGVILTSNNELHDIKSTKVIATDAYESIDQAVDLALQMLIGKDLYSNVYIGIDPGDKPGIAIVGDDILLQKTQVENPEKVVTVVKRFLKEYPSIQTLIRIGHGSIITRNRIINSLISLEIPIEIVDETKTTSLQQKTRINRDSEAAAAIALVQGGKVQSRLPLVPTKGEIKNIQERSRRLTNGRFSISEKTARDVLNGKISLKEAVELEKKNGRPKRL